MPSRLLRQAERPVIVIGGGVTASGAQAEMVALAEQLGIPFVSSLNGKSGLVDSHPLYVGVVGSYSRQCANRLVTEADLVFFVGSHTGGQVTASWKVPVLGTPVIQLDIDPLELGRNYPNRASLLGDARTVLQPDAGAGWRRAHERHQWHSFERLGPARRVGAARAGAGRPAGARTWSKQASSQAVPMRPERVVRELSEALPGRCNRGRRHGSLRHVDRPDARAALAESDVSTSRRVVGLGIPRVTRRKMRVARPTGRVLYR